MESVDPSGGALTSAAVPTMPPAPAWFSTTTGPPSAFESAGDAARVIVSTPDAVATGRMNLIGLSPCAGAVQATGSAEEHEARHARQRRSPVHSAHGRVGIRRHLVSSGFEFVRRQATAFLANRASISPFA